MKPRLISQTIPPNCSDASRDVTRRSFLQALSLGAAGLSLPAHAAEGEKVIQGFERGPEDPNASAGWKPVSDRTDPGRDRRVRGMPIWGRFRFPESPQR